MRRGPRLFQRSCQGHVRLFDTATGLIIIHAVVALPFSAFVMRNFFVGIRMTPGSSL
ncbi:hypothetical protein [Curtobacterium sp. MCBD17_003]|uniref:hypothetical protein n=1 Tax=Curtobacterium sp. MCBD17_003 TaxID=2175667 RepID=UPI0015E8BA71|nr:hypothetical protein [Curtobacterium sp. MCBD17_003]WIE55648.1 hypothetical protein DEI88_005460 [Curtobacterium sp. MCBD17_003]